MSDGTCTGPTALDQEVLTIETPSLGDRSYLAIADGWAVAVDPQRDIDRVERLLEERGATLGAVLETHLHNDYVTGGRALALRHGATYAVPAGPRLSFEAHRVHDGDTLRVGPQVVSVVGAPGHTDAHAAYEIRVDGAPVGAVFTGGSLLLGGTGRTDLLGADRAEGLARDQHRSVRRLAARLPGDSIVCPTHGFGSFCAVESSASGGATIADQLRVNPALLLDEDAFVAHAMDGLRPYPRYFAQMARRNAWFPTRANLAPLAQVPLADLADRPGTADTIVLDVRARAAYAAAHVERSLHVDARGAVASWFGWIGSIDAAVTLVASNLDEAAAVQRELRRIGVDEIRGVCVAPDLTPYLGATGGPSVVGLRRATFENLAAEQRLAGDVVLLDVREPDERRVARITGSIGIAAHELPQADLDWLRGRNVWVHCAAGFRAAIAASLLEREGIACVVVDDYFDVASGLGLTERPVVPGGREGVASFAA